MSSPAPAPALRPGPCGGWGQSGIGARTSAHGTPTHAPVTTQKSVLVSNASSIWMMFSCLSCRRISISCAARHARVVGSQCGTASAAPAGHAGLVPRGGGRWGGEGVAGCRRGRLLPPLAPAPPSRPSHLPQVLDVLFALAMLHDELHGSDLACAPPPALVHLRGWGWGLTQRIFAGRRGRGAWAAMQSRPPARFASPCRTIPRPRDPIHGNSPAPVARTTSYQVGDPTRAAMNGHSAARPCSLNALCVT